MLKMVHSPRSKVAVVMAMMAPAAVGSRVVLAPGQSGAQEVAEVKVEKPCELPNTIEEVIYRNAHHISQKELEEMTPEVRKGKPLSPAANKAACRKITEELKMKGRYWASVCLEEGIESTDRRVVFNITEGPVLRVRSISFVGGSELASPERLRTHINTSRAFTGMIGVYTGIGAYNEQTVEEDVKKLEDYFHANGYRFAKVTRKLIFSENYSTVDVVFHIFEGKRIKVAEVGITPLTQEEMEAVIRFVSQTSINGRYPWAKILHEVRFENSFHLDYPELCQIARRCGVRALAWPDPQANQRVCERIKARLVEDGYHWAKVTIKEGNRESDTHAVFEIEEGPLVHIRSINFVGNREIAGDALRAQVDRVLSGAKAVLLPAKLRHVEHGVLQDYCVRQGYRLAKVEHAVSFEHAYDEADVTFKIIEGPRTCTIFEDALRLLDAGYQKFVGKSGSLVPWGEEYKRAACTHDEGVINVGMKSDSAVVQEVVYKNARHISQKSLEELSKIRKGTPLDPVVNLLACQEIQDHLKNKGRYWARVALEEGTKLTDQRVVFSIDEGPIVRIQSTSFAGNTKIPTTVLQKLIGFREGVFSEVALQNDVEFLEEFYKAAGYRDVKVRRELSFSKDRSQAEVIFHIDEGTPVGAKAIIDGRGKTTGNFHLEIVPNLIPGAGRGGIGGGGGGIGGTTR